jgi:hypothetical protein
MSQAIDVGREGKKFAGGHGACNFKLTYYYKQRSKKTVVNDVCAVQPKLWKLATKKMTLLQHSPHYPGVLKLKARQLLAHSGFRNQLFPYPCISLQLFMFFLISRQQAMSEGEGKASLVKLTTRLQEDDGLSVTGLKANRLYMCGTARCGSRTAYGVRRKKCCITQVTS